MDRLPGQPGYAVGPLPNVKKSHIGGSIENCLLSQGCNHQWNAEKPGIGKGRSERGDRILSEYQVGDQYRQEQDQ